MKAENVGGKDTRAGEGVRLKGYHSAVKETPKGLVILIHGWEGSAESAYIVNTGRYLFRHGSYFTSRTCATTAIAII